MSKSRQFLARLTMRLATPVGISSLAAAVGVAVVLVVVTRPDPMPDFREFTAGEERKAVFFDFLQPLVEQANEDVLADRDRLAQLAQKSDLNWIDRLWVDELAVEYDIDSVLEEAELVDELFARVDAVPVSLALAQAAKESGWGTSRFAREGNNLFGEWCYEPGCGLVPNARPAGQSHEVEEFASAIDSIESYVRNLNTHWGYEEFRENRQRLRESQAPLTGLALVDALAKYSERGGAYVEEIRRMIRTNNLPQRVAAYSED